MRDSPAVIAAYDGIKMAIGRFGTLDARTRETIALAVGNEDGCDYCQAAHTVSAKRAGLSEEETIAIRADRIGFDARLASIAAVAFPRFPVGITKLSGCCRSRKNPRAAAAK